MFIAAPAGLAGPERLLIFSVLTVAILDCYRLASRRRSVAREGPHRNAHAWGLRGMLPFAYAYTLKQAP